MSGVVRLFRYYAHAHMKLRGKLELSYCCYPHLAVLAEHTRVLSTYYPVETSGGASGTNP